MEKKKGCLITCGVVALLILIAVGVAIFMVTRTVKQYTGKWKTLSDGYETINNEFVFTQSPESVIDKERFSVFMDVRKDLLDRTQQEFKTFEEMSKPKPGDKKEPSFSDGFKMMKTMAELPIKVGEKHQELLRERKMSFKEYSWTMGCMFATLQEGAKKDDPFCKTLSDSIQQSKGQAESIGKTRSDNREADWNEMTGPNRYPFSESNLNVLKAHESQIMETSDSLWADALVLVYAEILDSQKKVQKQP